MTTVIFLTTIFTIILYIIYLIFYSFYGLIRKLFTKNSKSKPQTKINKTKINIVAFFIFFIFSAYAAHDAVFPPESFYKSEFEHVTLRKIPESSKFISKESSYPDFHGDYYSNSKIQLPSEDYLKLLNEIRLDNRMKEIKNSSQTNKIIFQRLIENENDKYLLIEFDNDTQLISVSVSVT